MVFSINKYQAFMFSVRIGLLVHILSEQNRVAVRCPECQLEAGWHEPFVWLLGKEKTRAQRAGADGVEFNTGLAVALFPEVFEWRDAVNPYRRGSGWGRAKGNRWGVLFCPHCTTIRKHPLDWPSDLFYQVITRGKLIYARDRNGMVRLRNTHKSNDVTKKLVSFSLRLST